MQCLARSAGSWGVGVASRNDDIGIDIISVFPDLSFDFHGYLTSSGWLIRPVTALAAATAGEPRYTSLRGCPMRPTKLRLVVDTARSPSARTPMLPPMQGPQVGGPDHRARFRKYFQQTFGQGPLIHFRRGRNHDATDAGMNGPALQHSGRDPEVFPAGRWCRNR